MPRPWSFVSFTDLFRDDRRGLKADRPLGALEAREFDEDPASSSFKSCTSRAKLSPLVAASSAPSLSFGTKS